jgi:hypothetical protein
MDSTPMVRMIPIETQAHGRGPRDGFDYEEIWRARVDLQNPVDLRLEQRKVGRLICT